MTFCEITFLIKWGQRKRKNGEKEKKEKNRKKRERERKGKKQNEITSFSTNAPLN